MHIYCFWQHPPISCLDMWPNTRDGPIFSFFCTLWFLGVVVACLIMIWFQLFSCLRVFTLFHGWLEWRDAATCNLDIQQGMNQHAVAENSIGQTHHAWPGQEFTSRKQEKDKKTQEGWPYHSNFWIPRLQCLSAGWATPFLLPNNLCSWQ